jgi:CRISPR-associated endonuclease/helicase Cas3
MDAQSQVTWFAHSTTSADQAAWERLRDHLEAVSRRAATFGVKFGVGELGAALGLLHDLGKYDEVFLKRLNGANVRHDHSTAGAWALAVHYPRLDRLPRALGKLLAYAVAGHHAGLPDGVRIEGHSSRSPLDERLKRGAEQARAALARAQLDGFELPILQAPEFRPSCNELSGFQLAFFGRMLFSCLVDADFLETERFYVEAGESLVERPRFPSLAELKATFETYMRAHFEPKADTSPVNRLRADVLAQALSKAAEPPGAFTLTVPTGGGKTLTSLAFALAHAVRHSLDRIIYVIPFTSVIEQTADIFREALGHHAGAVLEHHSAFDESRVDRGNREAHEESLLDSEREQRMLRLAMENWDAPLVVTTAVQFFESLFGDRPSHCRKLHNIAKSVIILDEAQTLPIALLRPCVVALNELSRSYGATIVLCTATQPALNETDDPKRTFKGGFKIDCRRELAPDPPALFRHLKRVTIQHAGVLPDEDLASRLTEAEQVLCIVNTRAHARELYQRIKGERGTWHLSTLMCAAHRRHVLASIRKALEEGRACRVISTTLIEAGVDIDFPLVYRAEAGLDSIAQAAGRCNREGRRDAAASCTIVFDVQDRSRVLRTLRLNADLGRRIVQDLNEDALTPNSIERYFRELYWMKGGIAFTGDDALDKRGIVAMLNSLAREIDLPFESTARLFQLIDEIFLPIIVPYGDAAPLVEELCRIDHGRLGHTTVGGSARKLQPYSVGVPPEVRTLLLTTGAAQAIDPERFEQQFVWLTNTDLYSAAIGLEWGEPTFRRAETLFV